MKFGIATFVTDDSIDTVSLAQAIEDRGLQSLMVAEHTNIPASRETPYPGGGKLPWVYYQTLDPFVTLAAAAAVTSTIELVTGIALLIQRDPIITAKEAASIDLISNGRFALGVGAGWNFEEMRNHGTDPATRGALLDERIEAIQALWTSEPAEYHGKYVDFDPTFLRPKPIQQPRLPIYIGGNSDATVRRIVRHGAGWLAGSLPVEVLRARVEQIKSGASHEAPLAMFGAPIDPEYWHAAEELGFDQLALMLPSAPREESIRLLDQFADEVARYRG